MTAFALIPARLQSTRLARKVLADIHGKPMIWHVWNQVKQTTMFDEIFVVTDADEIREEVERWGGKALMTSPECSSGTDRIASAVSQLEGADLVVNVQGDEPLVSPQMLDDLVRAWTANPVDLITPVFPISVLEEVTNPNIVKVARTHNDMALYFSRSPIPYVRNLPQSEWLSQHKFWGHIGVYGYKRDVLAAYPTLRPSALELAEQLEQLRFLDAGYQFLTFETDYRPVAVDVADDLERVRQLLAGK